MKKYSLSVAGREMTLETGRLAKTSQRRSSRQLRGYQRTRNCYHVTRTA
ncbi:MAG: hypothetical protein DDT37_00751 [Firmicutes bacterium]|nr:hypothetical protein [candidate division NPL-UPA2 bacterium]